MNFKIKIFLLCIAVYIITLVVTCITITENSYQNILKSEVERFLKEEGNTHFSIGLYIMASEKQNGNISIRSFGQNIVDMFSSKDTTVELYDENLDLIAGSLGRYWNYTSREELKQALNNNKNYVFRQKDNNHYLFVSSMLKISNQRIILSVIKNVTYVDYLKTSQYKLFVQVGFIGLIFVAIISYFISGLVIKPIERLTATAKNITSGNYGVRVHVNKNKDEVGQMAQQFNIMTDELEKRISELQSESENKQLFIDNLTHELRTPLTSIIGYSDFLHSTKNYDDDTLNKSLGYIKSEGKRMLKMVSQMMDMILLKKNSLKLEKEYIRPLLEEVVAVLINKARDKKISLIIEGDDMLLNFDRDILKGVLINLTDNAINASNPEQEQEVILGTDYSQNSNIIYVKDYGKGIIKEDLAKILEPFYRVDKARSRKDGGMGLGLAICNEVVRAHNATLIVESEIGKGTIFKIQF